MRVIEEVLSECEYGVLSLVDGGEPYGVAVNFVYFDGALYFHGAREGRKVEAMRENPKVSFLAVRPLAYIPSYFSDTVSACPATQYFASVHLRGTVSEVAEESEKSRILNALMEKMQPEGGYESISAEHPIYTKMIEKTGVFKIVPDSFSCKLKAGQNLTEEKRASVIERLHKRGGTHDNATVESMQKTELK